MTDLIRTPTDDDELIDKIVAELELLEQHPNEKISDIASLFVHHNKWGNVYLDEMLARLASECIASKNQMKQQHEMILKLQKQMATVTDIHQVDSRTNVGEELRQTQVEQEPSIKAQTDTGKEQQVEQEQTYQESHQSQAKINETDVVMTYVGLLLTDSDQIDQKVDIVLSTKEINQRNVLSTQIDEQSQGIESLSEECNGERSGLMTRSNNLPLVHHYESGEYDNFSQSLRKTQAATTEFYSGIGSLTEPNKITEIERTDQQPEQFNDARHNNNDDLNKMATIKLRKKLKLATSAHPVVFQGDVQKLHEAQEERKQTIEASSPMEVETCDTVMNELFPLNVSSQMEQQQKIVRVRDIIRSDEQSSICESCQREPLRGIESMRPPIEQSNANDSTFVSLEQHIEPHEYKIVAKMEHQEQQRQSILDDSGHNNAHLDETVARLANDSATLKIQVKEQREMILKLQKQLQTVADIQRMNPIVMLRKTQQLHQIEVNEEATIDVRDLTQLQIGEMDTTNKRSPLSDSTQRKQVSESDTVKLPKEERDGRVTLPNISIDVEQRYEQEQTMPSPQMKVRFLRRRKIIPKQIASNSERSKAPPKNPKNARKKSGSHTCGECNKGLISKSSLIRHSRIHTGEKPFACTDCSAAFTDSSTLKKHRRIHSGEKPYVCTVCGVAFIEASKLKRHQKTHSGKKSNKCSVCKKEFHYKRSLEKHLQIHSK